MHGIPISAWIIQTREEADKILLSGGKLIVISEEVPDYLNSPQYGTSCIRANNLLPNYEAVSYFIDNDYAGYVNCYHQLLMQPESTIYFATIISAIINNIPIGFIFGNEEIEAAAAIEFNNFMLGTYGIKLGHELPFREEPPMPYGMMDSASIANNMSLLYMNNLLTPQEFLFIYPADASIGFECMQKLIYDTQPAIISQDMGDYIAYFDQFRKNIHRANKMLVDPMVRA